MRFSWRAFLRHLWSTSGLKHLVLLLLCVFSLRAHLWYRVPSPWLMVVLPWVGLALLAILFTLLVNYVLIGVSEDIPFRRALTRLQPWTEGFVGLFICSGMLVFINGYRDLSASTDRRSEVLGVTRVKIDLVERIYPLSWVDLKSWRHPQRVERVLLWHREDHVLWVGQPVIVQMKGGALKIPWVFKLEPDEERRARQILAAIPTAAEVWKDLINFYLDRRQWDEAYAATQEYLTIYPKDYDFAEGTAAAFGQARRHAQLVAILEPFLTPHPTYYGYNMVGFALGYMGRQEEGIKLIEQSIPMDPKSFWAYYNIGYIYRYMGNAEKAIPMFEKVLALRPNFPEIEAELVQLRRQLQLQQPISGAEGR